MVSLRSLMLFALARTILLVRRIFPRMKPSPFTKSVARVFKQIHPGMTVEIIKDLELKITLPTEKPASAFLDNLYVGYCQMPESKELLVQAYVRSLADADAYGEDVLLKDVVPVVRDSGFISGMQA